MHRLAALGLSAALAAGAAAPAGAADPPAPTPDAKPSWFGRMLGRPAAKDRTFGDLPVRPPVVLGPMDPVVQAEALKAELEAYSRRVAVCIELQKIALAKGDDKLAAQADDLEKQATTLYLQRAARLGVKAQIRTAGETLAADKAVTVAPPTPARQFREVKP